MEYFLIEMQYAEYAAKEELIESLTDLSDAYNLPDLTMEQVEVLNELTLATVGVYVTKVTSSIAKAWADFQAGFQDSMWISYKKIHSETFSSTFTMVSSENGITLPKLEKIKKFISFKLPKWDDIKDKPLESVDEGKKSLYKSEGVIAELYDDNKSIQDKAIEIYFKEVKDTISYTGADLTNYIEFMNEYSKLKDEISTDIKENSISAKKIKADAENAQSSAKKAEEKAKRDQEKAKADAEKAKAEADKEKADAEREAEQEKAKAEKEAEAAKNEVKVFNFANTLLEAVLYQEGNKFEAKEEPSSDSGSESGDVESEKEKSTGPLSDEDFKNKIDKITVFFAVCTEILSAKMKVLNKARSLSFDLIKQYCKLAEAKKKELKKEKKENGTDITEEKSEGKEEPKKEEKKK